jgi:hypothetical protein
MIVKTDKAKEIRKYYIKLENIFNEIVNEERLEYELEQKALLNKVKELEDTVVEKDIKHTNDLSLVKHNIILNKFMYKKCIYIFKVGKYLKIGSSGDLKERLPDLRKTFDPNGVYLEAFECDFYREVEQIILQKVDKYRHREPINGHKSKEVILETKMFNYDQLVTLIKESIRNFKPKNTFQDIEIKSLLERNYNEMISFKNDTLNLLSIFKNEIVNLKNIIINKEDKIEDKIENKIEDNIENDDNLNIENIENVENKIENVEEPIIIGKGRFIQQINPDNLDIIVKVHPSMIHLLRSNLDYEKKSIQNACKDNTIYKGFRWLFVENGRNPNIVYNIKYTVISKQSSDTCIIQLNIDKSKIIDTFEGVNAFKRKYNMGNNRLYKIIKDKALFSNSYFVYFKDCPKILLDEYKINNTINIKTTSRAKSVKRINDITKEETIFRCITDIVTQCGISNLTLTNAIKNKLIVKGYKYQYLI